MRKKLLAGVIAASMMFASLPAAVLAEEEGTQEAVTGEEETVTEAVTETEVASEPEAAPQTEAEEPDTQETEKSGEDVLETIPEGEEEVAPPAVSYPCVRTKVSISLPGEETGGSFVTYMLPDGNRMMGFDISLPVEQEGQVTGSLDIASDRLLLSTTGACYLFTDGVYDIMDCLFGKDGIDYMDALAVETSCIKLPAPKPSADSAAAWDGFLGSLSFLIPAEAGEYTAEGEEVFAILSEEAFDNAASKLKDYLATLDYTEMSEAVGAVCEQADVKEDSIPSLAWFDNPKNAFSAFWSHGGDNKNSTGRKLAQMFKEPYDNGADVTLHGWRNDGGCGLEYRVEAPVNEEGIGSYWITFEQENGTQEGVAVPGYNSASIASEDLVDVTGRFFYILHAAQLPEEEETNGEE